MVLLPHVRRFLGARVGVHSVRLSSVNQRCISTPSCDGSSSSSDAGAFDIAALAARLQVGERQVKRAIESLHEEGLHNYEAGEHIPKSDAEVIALLGLGRRLPPPPIPKDAKLNFEHESWEESAESVANESRSLGQENSLECERDMDDIIDAVLNAKQGQCHRATALIKRQGIHVPPGGGKDTRYELIPYDPSTGKDLHSQKLILGTNRDRKVFRNQRLIRQFLTQFRRPGMLKCDRCGTWWDSLSQTRYHSKNDGGCLGFCNRSSGRS